MSLLNLVRKEALEAGIRVGCTQLIRGVQGVLSKVVTSPRAQGFLNSKVGAGALTTLVGFGLSRANHDAAQSIGKECRVLGMARTGNGVVEHITGGNKTAKPEQE
jgi:hypothetical protein